MTATASKTLLENKHLGNGDHFVKIASFSHPFIVERAGCKWTGWSAVRVNIVNEWFNWELKHAQFWDADSKRKGAVFPYNLSSHNHIYIAKYLFSIGDD